MTGVRAYLASAGPDAARQWLGRTASLLTERGTPGTLGAVPHARGLIERHEGRTGKARASLASAAVLTIAPKTAAAHVEHIRTKLGVSRRAQIAAWVATQR